MTETLQKSKSKSLTSDQITKLINTRLVSRDLPALEMHDPVLVEITKLAGLCSPWAFFCVINHVFRERDRARANGHQIGFEHHEMKASHLGVIDHHSSGSEYRPERYWGLVCAGLMAALGAYLQLFSELSSVSEENPDFDQRIALAIMSQSLGESNSPAAISEFLDLSVPKLWAEEFAVFCQGESPRPLETLKPLDCDVSIWLPQQDAREIGLRPVVMIQCKSGMLPFKDGEWNHIVAHLVRQKLSELGLEHLHQGGVATWVVHSDKAVGEGMRGKTLPGTDEKIFPDWQTVKAVRHVWGISVLNDLPWHEQYHKCRDAIMTHQELANLAEQTHPVHPSRNVLAVATKPRAGAIKEYGEKIGNAQPGFLHLLQQMQNIGYEHYAAAAASV